jgi:hypothetical protein
VSPDPHRTAAGALTVRATGDDRVTGGAAVVAAEAFDGGVVTGTPVPPAAAPGTGTALPLTSGAGTAVAGFTGALTMGTASGRHAVWVRTKDALGNWGALANVLMIEDNQAPAVTPATTPAVVPTPTNGQVGYNPQSPYVRVTVSMTDALSSLTGMVGWVDTVSGPGTVFLASDGAWNGPTEVGQLLIPLATIRTLSNGVHNVRVQATDAAGNVSALISVPFTVDRTAPVVTGATLFTGPRRITVTGTDNLTGITGIEWFRGNVDPGVGNATQVAVSPATTSLNRTFNIPNTGTGTYKVRLRDAAGNWSTTRVVS